MLLMLGQVNDGVEFPHIKRHFLTHKSYCDNDLNKTGLTESDTVEHRAWPPDYFSSVHNHETLYYSL